MPGAIAGPLGTADASFSTRTSSTTATISSATLTAPTGLGATCTATTSNVVLTWTQASSPATSGYQILDAASSAGPFSVIGSVSGSTHTTYTDTIPLLTTRYYAVEATRAQWTSPPSNEITVTSIALGICTIS